MIALSTLRSSDGGDNFQLRAPRQFSILEILKDGEARTIEIAAELDVSVTHASVLLHNLRKRGFIKRTGYARYALNLS